MIGRSAEALDDLRLAAGIERGAGDAGLRAAGERMEGEAAGVAEAVEHFATGGKRAHALAVLALIQKEPGLLALLHVHFEIQAVLDDWTARRGAVAAHESRARL